MYFRRSALKTVELRTFLPDNENAGKPSSFAMSPQLIKAIFHTLSLLQCSLALDHKLRVIFRWSFGK